MTDQSIEEWKTKVEEIYSDYTEYLTTIRLDVEKQITTLITTASGASLALSIAMIKVFENPSGLCSLPFLYSTWLLFGLSLISAVISNIFELVAVNVQLDYAKRYFIDDDDTYRDKKNPWAHIRLWFTVIACVLFACGVISTVVFALGNI